MGCILCKNKVGLERNSNKWVVQRSKKHVEWTWVYVTKVVSVSTFEVVMDDIKQVITLDTLIKSHVTLADVRNVILRNNNFILISIAARSPKSIRVFARIDNTDLAEYLNEAVL